MGDAATSQGHLEPAGDGRRWQGTEEALEPSEGAWPCPQLDCGLQAPRDGREQTSVAASAPANLTQPSASLGLCACLWEGGKSHRGSEGWCVHCVRSLSHVDSLGPSKAKDRVPVIPQAALQEGHLLEKGISHILLPTPPREQGGGKREAWTRSARLQSQLCPDLPCARGEVSISSPAGWIAQYHRELGQGLALGRCPDTRHLAEGTCYPIAPMASRSRVLCNTPHLCPMLPGV